MPNERVVLDMTWHLLPAVRRKLYFHRGLSMERWRAGATPLRARNMLLYPRARVISATIVLPKRRSGAVGRLYGAFL